MHTGSYILVSFALLSFISCFVYIFKQHWSFNFAMISFLYFLYLALLIIIENKSSSILIDLNLTMNSFT